MSFHPNTMTRQPQYCIPPPSLFDNTFTPSLDNTVPPICLLKSKPFESTKENHELNYLLSHNLLRECLSTPTLTNEKYEKELHEDGPPTPTLIIEQPKLNFFKADLSNNRLYRKRMERKKCEENKTKDTKA